MGGSGQFFDQHPAQDLGAVVAEDWQCLRRLAARVAATDGSAPDHRERCGPCRLLARIATPNRLDCLPPFWAAFCASWGEPTLLLLAALLFGLGLIVWDYGFGGLWYFLTNLDEPAVADTGPPRALGRRVVVAVPAPGDPAARNVFVEVGAAVGAGRPRSRAVLPISGTWAHS